MGKKWKGHTVEIWLSDYEKQKRRALAVKKPETGNPLRRYASAVFRSGYIYRERGLHKSHGILFLPPSPRSSRRVDCRHHSVVRFSLMRERERAFICFFPWNRRCRKLQENPGPKLLLKKKKILVLHYSAGPSFKEPRPFEQVFFTDEDEGLVVSATAVYLDWGKWGPHWRFHEDPR